MNQILYVEKQKNNKPLNISTIIKIFAIIIIIFALILVGKGIYNIISSNKNDIVEPNITISQLDEKLQINISHNIPIDKIIYSWNGEEEVTLQGKGQTNIIQTIEIPVGTNSLNLKVIDSKQKVKEYTGEYYREDKDTIPPEIEFVVEGSKVKIIVKDETKLMYIMYHWNDEEDTVVEAREDSPKQIEEKISILKGENKLTILAVDEEGNETSKEQIFKGAKKPTIEVTQQNDEITITAKDEENIQKIEVTINGALLSTDPQGTGTPLNMQVAQITQKLQPGENNIIITVYNVSGLSEQETRTITI